MPVVNCGLLGFVVGTNGGVSVPGFHADGIFYPSSIFAGGDSIYGAPFADEFHSRLRFNHRGLLACANAGTPHSNGSQFFITLDRCDWLDKKNTIFGKVQLLASACSSCLGVMPSSIGVDYGRYRVVCRSLVILFSTFSPWAMLRPIKMIGLCMSRKFFQLR